jgi:OOP family OmpA-OmpF porin
VVGHTADVGNPAGQQRLSVERARTVAELLAESGMPPGAIRYEGRGGTEPVGDNASEEGRAANRRVEVIILN